jgi:hypothetical protein
LGVLYPLIILKCDINSKEFDDIIRMCYDTMNGINRTQLYLIIDLDYEIENIAIGDVTKVSYERIKFN